MLCYDLGIAQIKGTMKRRQVLKNGALLGAAGLVGAAGWLKLSGEDVARLTIEQVKKDLLSLPLASTQNSGGWTLSQMLNHLAQSIEYAISGYPQLYSAGFQNTAGKAAFALFSWRGRMHHDLAEPIPGEPVLDDNDRDVAMTRLLQALDDFQNHQGALSPHFAYGQLSHADYTLAHVMHINDHLAAWAGQSN